MQHTLSSSVGSAPIGRDGELTTLLDLIDRASAAGGHVVLVVGDAGLGKTTLLDAAVARAAANGVTVAKGRARAEEAVYPYAAFSEVVSSLRDHRDAAVRRRVEDLETALAHGSRGVDEEAELHRRAFQATAALLAEVAEQGPLVLAIDDLHAADGDSLVLFGLLVRRLAHLPVAWVATVRSDLPERRLPLDNLVHSLSTEERLHTVSLAPLADDVIVRVVEQALGGAQTPSITANVVGVSRGNPFYAIHTALVLAEDGSDGDAVPSLSRRVALLQRVLPLGGDVRALARLLAVAGSCEVGRLPQLASITGLDAERAVVACDRMVRAGILTGTDRLEYGHAILRDALYADLGPAERRRIHSELADRFTALRRRGERVDVLEIARHIMAIAPEADADRAAVLIEAGDAVARTAPRSAAAYYGAALDRLPRDSPRAPGVRTRLAAAAWRSGAVHLTVDTCRSVLPSLPVEHADQVVVLLAAALGAAGRPREGLEAIDAQAAAHRDTARLRAMRAGVCALLDRDAEAQEDAAFAIELAGASIADRVAALDAASQVTTISVRDTEAVALVHTLLATADEAPPSWRLRARRSAAYTFACVGDIVAAEAALAEAAALQEVVDDHANWDLEIVAGTLVAFHRGDWNEARRRCQSARLEFDDSQHALCAAVVAFVEGTMALESGDVATARSVVDRQWPAFGHVDRIVAAVLAGADAYDGRFAEAEARLLGAIDAAQAPFRMTVTLLHRLVDVRLAAGDKAGAVAAAERLVELVGDDSGPGFRVITEKALASANDDAEAAVRGIELAAAHGMRSFEATLRYEAARLGVDPKDNLLAAIEVFNQAGATVWRRHTVAELRRWNVPIPRRRRVFGLTDAELDICRLVQAGRRNREIAQELHYSEKTVEAYLSRIYSKTGCANRLALARYCDSLDVLDRDASPVDEAEQA